MNSATATRYVVEVTHQDFVAGTRRGFSLPKRYETRTGAEKAAQAMCWVARPDADGPTACKIEKAGARKRGRC